MISWLISWLLQHFTQIKIKFLAVLENITDKDYWVDFLNDIKWWIIGFIGLVVGIVWLYFAVLDFKCNMKAKAINHTGEYSWWLDECVFAKGNDKFLLRQIKRLSIDGEDSLSDLEELH